MPLGVAASFFVTGTALGMGSGLTPGPLSTLAITQTLQHGPREGAKICLAPVITDLPIVAAVTWLLSSVTHLDH